MSDNDPNPKRLKTEEIDAPISAKHQPQSLALTSCRAVEKSLIDELKSIPKEAAARTADRRRKLRIQMMKLDDEEKAYIKKREEELSAKRDDALKHMKSVEGSSDSYCKGCNSFYKSEPENRCSVEGCLKHKSCQDCFENESIDIDGGDDAASECSEQINSEKCWWECDEEYGLPPATGSYSKCWICDKEFCTPHFEKHYSKCRSNASKRCGFRPLTSENGGRYRCVPGHCGKELTKNERKRNICYPQDGICCTVSCNDCVDVCENEASDEYNYYNPHSETQLCGQRRCKQCAQKECLGICYS